jgi:hypothetical protein
MGHFFEFAAFSLSQNAAHAGLAHLSEGDLLRAFGHALLKRGRRCYNDPLQLVARGHRCAHDRRLVSSFYRDPNVVHDGSA